MQNRNRLTDRKQIYVPEREGAGEGQIRSMGLTDTNYYVSNRQATRFHCVAHGIITTTF